MSVEKAMEQRIWRELEARLPLMIAEGVRKEFDRQKGAKDAGRPAVASAPTGRNVTPKKTAETKPVDVDF